MTARLIPAWLSLLPLCVQVHAGLPAGLMIVAYDGTSWHPYVIMAAGDDWSKIEQVSDPAAVTWIPARRSMLVKAADGGLCSYHLERREFLPLSPLAGKAVTQLRAHRNGVMMVQLTDGRSSATQLLSLDADAAGASEILRQQSAQFYPYLHNGWLYYAHVSCRAECRPLIQEVWRKDMASGLTSQLTRLNAVSHLYSASDDGHYGFLVSNQRGYYHLARLELESGEISWLTRGQVTDSHPSIAADGKLYFIRHTPTGSRLMRLNGAMTTDKTLRRLEEIELPADVEKIRYLEIAPS
jgi:hypothetical protein